MTLDPPPAPVDPFAALKEQGKTFLTPLGCEARCQIRRRTSFGYVLEVCGLCQRHHRVVPVNDETSEWVGDRFEARLHEMQWDRCPTWALRYLSDGPKPVPWAAIQLAGQTGNPDPAAPIWAVQLLYMGTPMRSYVKRSGAIALDWPKVFTLCAWEPETRDALAAIIALGKADSGTSRYAFREVDCERVYNWLLDQDDSLFGGSEQKDTKLVVRSPR